MVSKESIRRFFIQKLASIISQHSEKGLPLSPLASAEVDWLIAERCMDINYPHQVERAFKEINEKSPEKYDFEDFERDWGFMIWDVLFIKFVSSSLPSPVYRKIWIYQ